MKMILLSNVLAAVLPTRKPVPAETVEHPTSNKPSEVDAGYGDTRSNCHQIKNLLFENRYLQGITLIEQKKYPQALNEFDRLLTHEPDNPLFHLQRGICLKHLGEFEGALPPLFTALTLDPQNGVAVKNIAACYQSLRQKQASAWWYGLATRLNPHDPDVWRGLGECYDSLKMANEVVQSYKKEIDLIASLRDDIVADVSQSSKSQFFCPCPSKIKQMNEYTVRLIDRLGYIGRYHLAIGHIDEAKNYLLWSISTWADTRKITDHYNLRCIDSGLSSYTLNLLKFPAKQKQMLVLALGTLADCHVREEQISEALDCLQTILDIEPAEKIVRERIQNMVASVNDPATKSEGKVSYGG